MEPDGGPAWPEEPWTEEEEPETRVETLSREIESIRRELVPLLAELDYRRHELLNVRVQARRHPIAVAGAALVVAGSVGWAAWSAYRTLRSRRAPTERIRRFRRALRRAIADPDRVAAGDPTWEQRVFAAILRSAGATAAATAIRESIRSVIRSARMRRVAA